MKTIIDVEDWKGDEIEMSVEQEDNQNFVTLTFLDDDKESVSFDVPRHELMAALVGFDCLNSRQEEEK